MIELCACGHSNDHVGKPCSHPVKVKHPATGELIEGKCACQLGTRSDVAIAQGIAFTNRLLRDLTAVMLEANGLEVARDGKIVRKSGLVRP